MFIFIRVFILKNYCPTIYRTTSTILVRKEINSFFVCSNELVMLNNGLMIMVNSDDPAYFGGYINKNFIECQKALNLSMEEVQTLIK